jgi:hypothetical protein
MAIDVGTIGHRKCEVNLNKILMEVGDEHTASFVVKNLVNYRMGLRQLLHVPDESWRHGFMDAFNTTFIQKVKSKSLPPLVESHTLCCVKAYYRDARQPHQGESHDPTSVVNQPDQLCD